MSVLEKLKALDEQRAKLLDDAKKEALDAAEKAVDELNSLGFDCRLVEGAARKERSEGARPKALKRQARDLPCPVCDFKTTPHHDGRAHKSQKTKKPFTAAELADMGYVKVG